MDITYLRTLEGRLDLSLVLDTYSRRIVGRSSANNLETELVLDVVNTAIYTPRPSPGLIHHYDSISQHTSLSSETAGLKRKVFCPRWDWWPTSTTKLDGRDLGLYLREGADPLSLMAEPSDSEDGYLRVHRGLLQHKKETLCLGISVL